MKRLLSLALAAVLVLAPVSSEAKSKARGASSCTGVQTVEYKAGKKIVDTRISCRANAKPPKGGFVSNAIDWD